MISARGRRALALNCRFRSNWGPENSEISHFKGRRRSLKVLAKESQGLRIRKPKRQAKREIIDFGIFHCEGKLIATLPITTVSEANCSESWQKRHIRHARQKDAVNLALSPSIRQIKLPCRVTVIRYASRFLDAHDNLRMSLKYIVDQVADCLVPGLKPGRADDDRRITWAYDQVKSKEKYIKIVIEF